MRQGVLSDCGKLKKTYKSAAVTFLVTIVATMGLSFSFSRIHAQETSTMAKADTEDITITVIYDNNPYKEGLDTAWGFACLIRGMEKTILFDTGGNGSLLMKNMDHLGISPHTVDVVFLSHAHDDHIGGLESFLKENPDVTVYPLASFPERFIAKVKDYGAHVIEVQESLKVCEGVYSTGEMGKAIKEHALVFHTKKGLIVITGCAHPGIVAIVQRAMEIMEEEIRFVMGGFHLGDESHDSIKGIISSFKQMGVRYVGVTHCSGDTAREAFQKAYREKALVIGVGRVITMADVQ